MPSTCPVCTRKCYDNYQSQLECSSCRGWVHHGNRLKCSGLTDAEFTEHLNDENKIFECDFCVSSKIAKENNSIFVRLPFPVECEGNIFGKPVEKGKLLSICCQLFGAGCLELSSGCLELSVGCLDLSCGWLDLSVGGWQASHRLARKGRKHIADTESD